MNKFNHIIINRHQDIIKYFIILSSIFLIFLTLPEGGLFKYEFKKNTPWSYEDLFADFDFPVSKSESEYQLDLAKQRKQLTPFYTYDSMAVTQDQKKYIDLFQEEFQFLLDNVKNKDKTGLKITRKKLIKDSSLIHNQGFKIISYLYNNGIIHLDDEHKDFKHSQYIKLQKGGYTEKLKLKRFRAIDKAELYIQNTLNKKEPHFRYILSKVFDELIEENVKYDNETTETFFDKNNNVLKYKGSIQKGQRLISKGDPVNPEKHQVLLSYQKEYNLRKRGNQNTAPNLSFFCHSCAID